MSVPVYIALGSNLGDREAHLAHAITRLSGILSDLRVSSFYNTPAEGVTEPQPDYLNAALSGMTTLPPADLLEAMESALELQGVLVQSTSTDGSFEVPAGAVPPTRFWWSPPPWPT